MSSFSFNLINPQDTGHKLQKKVYVKISKIVFLKQFSLICIVSENCCLCRVICQHHYMLLKGAFMLTKGAFKAFSTLCTSRYIHGF